MPSYVLSGLSWANSTLKWYYGGDAAYATEVAEAFAAWDAVIGLDFVQVTSASEASINVVFEALDGPSNTLAVSRSTYYVESSQYVSNTIAFDTAKSWTWSASAGTYVLAGGTSFYGVALHEIGHSNANSMCQLRHPRGPSAARG